MSGMNKPRFGNKSPFVCDDPGQIDKAAEAQWREELPAVAPVAPAWPPTRPKPEKCECCGKKCWRRMSRDHCHKVGRFRGWICGNCNSGIGLLGDDWRGVATALIYLAKHDELGQLGDELAVMLRDMLDRSGNRTHE